MRKRTGRLQRFAAIPNDTIDDAANLDLTALGLLAVLIRHRDGWDVTLADIGARYGYGEDALARAMGLLQVARYVVKIRIMSTQGNRWSTDVVVYDTPATDDEIDALVSEIRDEPGVRDAQLIQPTKTALTGAAKRREKLSPDSGVSRDSGDPGVSKKTVPKKTKNTSPSPLVEARQSQPSHRQEEEGSPTDGNPSGQGRDGGDVDERQAQAVELVSSLPDTLTGGNRNRLVRLTVDALAAGWTPQQLRAELLRDLGSAASRVGVWVTRLRNLGEPPSAAATSTAAALPPRCDHPDHDPYGTDRLLYPADGPAHPCPTCHPSMLGDA